MGERKKQRDLNFSASEVLNPVCTIDSFAYPLNHMDSSE